jgi:hypothetical protein
MNDALIALGARGPPGCGATCAARIPATLLESRAWSKVFQGDVMVLDQLLRDPNT